MRNGRASLQRVMLMQESDLITLKVLLPFGVFAEKADVLKVVADTNVGSVGICHIASIVWRR